MPLRVKIRQISDNPPPIFIRGHVPDLVLVAENHFLLDSLDMLNRLIMRLTVNVVSYVVLAMRVVIDAVLRQLSRRYRVSRNDAVAVLSTRFSLLWHSSLLERPNIDQVDDNPQFITDKLTID